MIQLRRDLLKPKPEAPELIELERAIAEKSRELTAVAGMRSEWKEAVRSMPVPEQGRFNIHYEPAEPPVLRLSHYIYPRRSVSGPVRRTD